MTNRKEDFSVLGLIPARGGSKGIPRKNVKPLCGKPLIAYTIEAALRSRLLTEVMVSSDDDEVIAIAKDFGAMVPFKRPAELATDRASQLDVIRHAVSTLEQSGHGPYDALVLLQPTTPLRLAEDIDDAIEKLITTNVDCVFSVCLASELPHYMYILDGDRPRALLNNGKIETRRQDYEEIYIRNGAVYAVRKNTVFDYDNIYGADFRTIEMPWNRSVNIDSHTDWELAHFLAERADRSKDLP